jgi:HK97 family phage major capsid protein
LSFLGKKPAALFILTPLKEEKTMSKILELRNKRNTLWEQTKAFLEDHRDANGLVDASAVEQYNKMASDVKALGDEIERLENQAEMDAKLSQPTSAPVHADPKVGAKKNVSPTATAEYNEAFWNMLRNRGNYGQVMDALSVGEDPKGGYTVPDEFEKQLVEALEENNIFRSIATVIRTSSGTRKIPIAEDSGEASWIDEGEEIPEADTTFGQTTLGAYKMGTMIKISNELLNDSAFDLASYIARRFGVRMGNAEEKAFFTGDGQNKPLGLLADNGGAPVGVTASTQSKVTFDEVFQLYYALKSPYRKNAQFLCNEALLLQLMTLKDKNDNYIWKPSLEVWKPNTLLGRPIITSTYMPAIAAGAKALVFGDYSYYWVADRQTRTFKRLNELYARTDQVGFISTQRVDGKLILPEAVQVLQMKASA